MLVELIGSPIFENQERDFFHPNLHEMKAFI